MHWRAGQLIKSLKVKVGDKIKQGDVLGQMESGAAGVRAWSAAPTVAKLKAAKAEVPQQLNADEPTKSPAAASASK